MSRVYIPCQHSEYRVLRDKNRFDPDDAFIILDPEEKEETRIVVLCRACYDSLSYSVLTRFNRDSQKTQPYTTVNKVGK
jgi:hypothetical protein